MGGYMWDDDEWMRRIERAEDGDATASAVLALYDTLMSHDDVPAWARAADRPPVSFGAPRLFAVGSCAHVDGYGRCSGGWCWQ